MSGLVRVIDSELRFLAAQNAGILTPEAVVAAAQEPTSPMHDHFTWDDADAAAERRLDQARALIRSVRVIHHDSAASFRTVVWVRDPTQPPTHQGYVRTDVLATDRDKALAALENEFDRVDSIIKRARDIAMGLGLTPEMDAFLTALADIRTRIATAA